jgi:amidase
MNDLLDQDGLAQAERLRRGEVSSRELVASAIERIEARDPVIHAVSVKRYARALDEAAGLTASAASDLPFAGAPFLLKDLGPTCAGSPATLGSAFMAGFVPDADGELIRRFRAAGLIALGKTNTAEFGALPTTEPAFGDTTVNPWDVERSVGGSSGGAAAAVAARYVAAAHANDAGGSIRIPASCCGVFGLKTTRARVPMGPSVGDLMNGLACEFVVSRSVRDSAALLDAVAGPALGDPYVAPPRPASYLQAVAAGLPRRLRIAVTPYQAGEIHADCQRAVDDAVALCASLGHEIVYAAPPVRFSALRELFLLVWSAGVSSAIASFAGLTGRKPSPDKFEDVTWWLYEEGQRISAASYLVTITRLQQAARRLAEFHDRHDVHLSTVTSEPAPRLGVLNCGPPTSCLERALDFVADTPLANLTGDPAMSVPLYRRNGGLPVGVHFTGKFGDEATLLMLAAELEAARPWNKTLPRLD